MRDIDELDRLSQQAINRPITPQSSLDSLRDRNRLRQRRRTRFHLTAYVALAAPLVLLGAILIRRAPTTTVNTAAGPIPVSQTLGAHLDDNGALWPKQPVPLDQLLDTINSAVLKWPDLEWDRSGLTDTGGGITGYHPTVPDRRVIMEVHKVQDGWQILTLYPAPGLLLSEGDLKGFTGLEFPSDTATIEIFHYDGERETLSTLPLERGQQGINLPASVPPEKAGTLLIIGRTKSGEATVFSGLALGSPTQLTIAIDRLIDAAEPAAAPPLLVQALSAHPDFLSLGGPDLDLSQTLVLHEIAADLDLYILLYPDRSQSCMYILDRRQDGESMHGGCDDGARNFNQNGNISFSYAQNEADGYTVAILPDHVTISDEVITLSDESGGTIHPSGHVVVVPGDFYDKLEIDRGELRLTD